MHTLDIFSGLPSPPTFLTFDSPRKTFDPVISTMSKEAFLRVSTWNNGRESEGESPQVATGSPLPFAMTLSPNKTKNRVFPPKQTASVASTESKKDKRELLARKVGSKIDQLVSQLFEEHAMKISSP